MTFSENEKEQYIEDQRIKEAEEEIKPLEVTIKKDETKESPKEYEGEDSYQYEDLNPTEEQLKEDFD